MRCPIQSRARARRGASATIATDFCIMLSALCARLGSPPLAGRSRSLAPPRRSPHAKRGDRRGIASRGSGRHATRRDAMLFQGGRRASPLGVSVGANLFAQVTHSARSCPNEFGPTSESRQRPMRRVSHGGDGLRRPPREPSDSPKAGGVYRPPAFLFAAFFDKRGRGR